MMPRAAIALCLAACGGGSAPPPADPVTAPATTGERDPHRHLDANECGRLYDFMHDKGWMGAADAPRETVVKGCVDSPEATRAFLSCVLASETREESERCQ